MSKENSNNNIETFEIIIRSAMQSFSDRKVQCPADWTVLQLKEHLYKTVLIKPEVSRQRLIYAGHCLENSSTIRSILKGRAETSADSDVIQVFHLVYYSKETLQNVLTSNVKTNLRQRTNIKSSTPNGTPITNYNVNENATPNAQTPYGLNGLQRSFNSYDYYSAYYQNYINQIIFQQQLFFQQQGVIPMQYFSNYCQNVNINQSNNLATTNATDSHTTVQPPQQQFVLGNANIMPFGLGGRTIPFNPNVDNPLFLANLNNNNGVLNQERNLNENNNNNGNAAEDVNRRPDLLETIYKLIRFILLIMLIYFYASMKHSILVLLTLTLIWFLRYRERRNQNEQLVQQEIQNQQNLREEVQQERNENYLNANGVQDNVENVSGVINLTTNVSPSQTTVNRMSAWTVFWSTVSSFFTSLIPENPVPVNIN